MDNIDLAIQKIKQALPGMTLLENEPMSLHSSFRIGGPVRAIAMPQDMSSLSKLCSILKSEKTMPMVVGNCTNLLFPDEGLKNLLIISTENLQRMFLLPDGAIYAEAGVSLAKLAAFAQQNGLQGLEFASGIPGTVGGGIIMNAGAYNGELKDAVESVVSLYYPDQGMWELTREQCKFGYRTSVFKSLPGAFVISAVFRLPAGDKEEIAAKMRELSEKRRSKQPLEYPSAGSAFKRPDGYFAAALIEECGLKGFTIGGAQVSEKHSGFVINIGGATAKDVYELMKHIRNTVYLEKHITLEPEIIMLPPDFTLTDSSPEGISNRITVNDASAAAGTQGN